MFEEWAQLLPPSWVYKSHRVTNTRGLGRYNAQYDVYSDPWIACIWNCYRNVRLLIHEAIIVASLNYGSDEHHAQLQASEAVLASMSDGICHSAVYLLGSQHLVAEGSEKSTSFDATPSHLLRVLFVQYTFPRTE